MEEFLDNAYYEIENLQLGFDITAYVENEEDVSFWGSLFYKYAPQLKVNFEYNSRGNLVRGKGEILKSKHLLGPSFILCLDSDLDYLLQRPFLSETENPLHPFILHTYTYSIENHKCNPANLNLLCQEATMSEEMPYDFNFVPFMAQFSSLTYKLLLYLVYFNRQGVPPKIIQRRNLYKLLSVPNKQSVSLRKQGYEIINRIRKKLEQVDKTLRAKCPQEALDALAQELEKTVGLTPENTYLFLPGHVLYDNIAKVVRLVVSRLFAERIESFIATAEKHAHDEKESRRLKHKISEYKNLTRTMHVQTLLATNHLKCLAYGNCTFMEHIGEDITHLLALRKDATLR